MPTLEEVHQQINSLEHKYIFYTKKEINYLPEIMVDGEYIRAITSGFLDHRTVLAVCTNRRVIFLDKGMFFGLKQWQMPLDRIQSIDGDYLIFFGKIRIWDGAAPMNIKMVLAGTIDPFIKETRQAMDDFRKLAYHEVTSSKASQHLNAATGHPDARASASHGTVDVASQLERLAALKDSGHLTEKEFEAQKKKILNS